MVRRDSRQREVWRLPRQRCSEIRQRQVAHHAVPPHRSRPQRTLGPRRDDDPQAAEGQAAVVVAAHDGFAVRGKTEPCPKPHLYELGVPPNSQPAPAQVSSLVLRAASFLPLFPPSSSLWLSVRLSS